MEDVQERGRKERVAEKEEKVGEKEDRRENDILFPFSIVYITRGFKSS